MLRTAQERSELKIYNCTRVIKENKLLNDKLKTLGPIFWAWKNLKDLEKLSRKVNSLAKEHRSASQEKKNFLSVFLWLNETNSNVCEIES